MCSPGINGEGELRGQPANAGSRGKMAVKMQCVCDWNHYSLSDSPIDKRLYDISVYCTVTAGFCCWHIFFCFFFRIRPSFPKKLWGTDGQYNGLRFFYRPDALFVTQKVSK